MRYLKDLKGRDFSIGKIFYLFMWNGGFWFRFFKGYGLHCRNMRKHEELFSERYGHTKYIQIAKYRFKILKP